jgi:hypothetical protein
MANKYFYQGTDFDRLCEPNAPMGFTTVNACPFQNSYFGNMGGYASYDANYGYMSNYGTGIPNNIFQQAGANVGVAALGRRPRLTTRFDFTTPDTGARTYFITRSDSSILVYDAVGTNIYSFTSTEYTKMPYIMFFYLVGAGGGGAAGGGAAASSGGGGGGGGIITGWIEIATTGTWSSGTKLVVGGIGSGATSYAIQGNDGGASYLYYPTSTLLFTAGGGQGGWGYNNNSKTGLGGTNTIPSNTASYGTFSQVAGGKGGQGGNGNYPGANCSITSNFMPESTSVTNSANGGTANSTGSGGGASYGTGGINGAGSAGGNGTTGGGGGGGDYTIFDGKYGGNGGPGFARLFY